MNDHSDCDHPELCKCGKPVSGEANFPDKPRNVEELTLVLSAGGIIVQTFYVCDDCLEFAIQVCEQIGELEEVR